VSLFSKQGRTSPTTAPGAARRSIATLILAGLVAGIPIPAAWSAEECPMHPAPPGESPAGAAGNGVADSYPRSLVSINIPDVVLEDADGVKLPLATVLGGDKPVMLNFIFTTCGTICPVMSAVFATVREDLGADGERIRMVSISIDPEQDTPSVLREYAKKLDAGPGWVFLTGRLADIITVQQAFGAFRGNKMTHQPFTFLRSSPASQWVRIGEIVSADNLEREARAMLAAR